MEIALALAVVLAVAWFVTAPLRAAAVVGGEDPRRADLEARKESKYREIRDAELDHAEGKLSDEDWRAADAELRREAIEILEEIDRLGGPEEAGRSLRKG